MRKSQTELTAYEVGSLLIQSLALLGLWAYFFETRRIRKINYEALEAPVRPHVGLSLVADTSEDGFVDAVLESRPVGMILASDDLVLVNTGAGPAVELRMQIQNDGWSEPLPESLYPVLSPGGTLDTHVTRTSLVAAGATVFLAFESVNGVRYESAIRIVHQKEAHVLPPKVVGRSKKK